MERLSIPFTNEDDWIADIFMGTASLGIWAKDNNRKSITLNAVRIPVQGLNSMEFMEVYEFLDPSAGSIIILPTEIVAKSGGDYDVDKLTTFFPNIDDNGNYVTSEISNEEFFDKIKDVKDPTQLIKLQKKAVQNQMIDAIKSILEIEENYAALVKPNDTYIIKTKDIFYNQPEN